MVFSSVGLSQPIENSLANPIILSSGTGNVATGTSSNVVASNPSWATNAVWFKWTSPVTGRATFKTAGSTFDTVMEIYQGPTNSFSQVNADLDLSDFATQITFDVVKDQIYYIVVDGSTSSPETFYGVIFLSWSSGSQSAGFFRFSSDLFVVSEGDISSLPKDISLRSSTPQQALITVTRDQAAAGNVEVDVSYESFVVTNTYETNQISGTNFVVNTLDSLYVENLSFDSQGIPAWRSNDFQVAYITNYYPASVGTTGRFIYITISPAETNIAITNIFRTPQFTLRTDVAFTNHFGNTLTVITITNQVQTSSINTNFSGTVRWTNSLAGPLVTNYFPFDFEIPGQNFDVTITTNSTNVVLIETVMPLTPPLSPIKLTFKDFEMSKSFAIDVPFESQWNPDREIPVFIEDVRLVASEDPNIKPPDFDFNQDCILRVLDDQAVVGGTPTLSGVVKSVQGGTPTVYFERRHFGVYEYNGDAVIYVKRVGPSGVAADVNFEVAPVPPGNQFFGINAGSDYATRDVDFQSFSGTVHWDADDTTPKAITIPIFDDGTVEFNEDFLVRLSAATGSGINSVNRDAIVTINFDEQPAGSADRNYNPPTASVALPGANGAVYAVAVQPPGNGRSFIGGDFSSVNTVPIVRIARLNSNGQLDTTFDPKGGPDDFVACMIPFSDGSVLIGGRFGSVDGIGRAGIAKLTSTGAIDQSFNPGSGCDGTVWTMALQPDGKILIGGDFTHVSGNLRKFVARLNADGTPDLSFNTSNGPDDSVLAVAYNGGKVLIGGEFGMVGSSVRNAFGQLNADGSLDSGFDPGDGVNGTVHAIVVQNNGKILIGGGFSTYDFRLRKGIAQLNSNGALDTTYDPYNGFDDTVYSISLQSDGKPVIVGKFNSYNGVRRIGVARLLTSGYLDTTFMDTAYNQFAGIPVETNSSPKNFIFSVALQSSGAALIGGDFREVGGGSTRADFSDRRNFSRLVPGATGGPGNVQLRFDTYSADENDLTVSIELERVNGNLGSVEVTVATNTPPQGPGVADSADYQFNGPSNIQWGSLYPTSWMQSVGSTTVEATKIRVRTDSLVEGNEIAYFDLTDPISSGFYLGGERIPLGVALGRQHATLTIVDANKKPGTLAFLSPNFQVDETAGYALITVIRTNGSYNAASIQFATTGGSANSSDYFTTNGTLDFAAGATSATFKIFIKDDTEIEINETVGISLFNPSPAGVTLATNGRSAVLSIIDNDLSEGRLGFSVTNYTVSEDSGVAIVTVNRSGGSTGLLTVQYATANGTALEGVDYVGVTNTLLWNGGDAAPKTFTIPIKNNNLVDANKALQVRLFNPSVSNVLDYGTITNATITITNEDAYGMLSFSSTNYHVNENNQEVTVVVVRTQGTNGLVTVNYSTSESTNSTSAHAGTNYVTKTGTLTFLPGQLSAAFNIGLIHDPSNTGYKYFTVGLSNATPSGVNGAVIGVWSNALITITDAERNNEPAGSVDPTFNFTSGANDLVYAVVIQNAAIQSGEKVLIGGDFTQVNGITRNRVARLNADGTLDKSFLASNLGANDSVRAVVSQTLDTNAIGRVLIGGLFTTFNGINRSNVARLNLDGSLDLTFNPGSGANGPVYCLAETVSGNTPKVLVAGGFTSFNAQAKSAIVRLNSDGSLDSTFDTGLGVNGTIFAMAVQPDGKVVIGGDFTMINNVPRFRVARLNVNGSVDMTFDPGAGPNNTIKALAVHYDGGILVGGLFTSFSGTPASYMARLNPYGAVDSAFTPNPDGVVQSIAVQVDGKILVGGNFSRANNVTRGNFTRMNADGTVDPRINFGLGANGGVSTIAVQQDGNIVIGGGFTQFDGITRNHVARLFGGELSGTGTLEFTASIYAVNETATNALVGVRRRGGTDQTGGAVRVQFDTADLTGFNGVDYSSVNTMIDFPRGETFRTVTIPVLHNPTSLSDAEVQLTLSNAEGDAVVTNQPTALLVISNVDSTISFSATNYVVNENEISGFATIYLQRSGSLQGAVTVDCTTFGGSAVPGVRYVQSSQTIIFEDGEATKTFNVQLINDSTVEGDETIGLVLANFQSTLPGGITNATITVIEDDFGPGYFSFVTNNFFVIESQAIGTVTVVRTNGHTGSASVRIATSDGTAISGVDYVATNGTLIFADGQTSSTFAIEVIDNSVIDTDKTVNLTLSNPTNGFLGGLLNSTLTLLDDDYLTNYLAFSTNRFFVNETDGTATITVVRTVGRRGVLTVDFSVTAGTAVDGFDFVSTNGTIVFQDNQVEQTFSVRILDNTLIQGSRTINLALANPTPGSSTFLALSNSVLTVLDDDLPAGSLDPNFASNYGANSNVYAVTFDVNERLYVGGDFTYIHGLNINHIARLDTNGTVDLNFDPGTGADAGVYAIARGSDSVFIGGAFTNVNGVASRGIAQLDLAGSVVPGFNVGSGADGIVKSIAVQNDQFVVVGGDFNAFNGFSLGKIARLTPNGLVDSSFSIGVGANGIVNAVAVQTNGQILVGGDFTAFDNALFTRLARLNANGALDFGFDVGIGADGAVRAIALQADDKILVAGDFVTFNGVPRNHIVRLNANGTVDLTFDPGDGADGPISSITVTSDGKIILGGSFNSFNGNQIHNLVRLNKDGSFDTNFNSGSGANGPVHSVALANVTSVLNIDRQAIGTEAEDRFTVDTGANSGTVIIDYDFLSVPDNIRVYYDGNRIFELFTNGLGRIQVNYGPGSSTLVTVVMNEGSGIFGTVWLYSMTIVTGAKIDNRIGVGGDFTKVNGISRGRIAVLNSGGSVYNTFDPAAVPNNSISALGLHTNIAHPELVGKVVAGGDFSSLLGVGGQNKIGRLNPNGTLDRTFHTSGGPDKAVRALAVQPDDKVIIGGLFTTFDSVSRAYLARVNIDGTLDTGFNTGVGINNPVFTLALQPDGKILIGGAFTQVYGVSRNSIARVHSNGTVDTSFAPGSGANGPVKSLALQNDGKVVIVGDFTSVAGNTNLQHIARLGTNGAVDLSLVARTDGSINAVALQPDGNILIGGAFTSVNGQSFQRIARLLPTGALDPSFNPGSGAGDFVNGITVQADGKILVEGGFVSFDGQIRNRVTRLTSNGALDPGINFGTGANSFVNSAVIQTTDDKIIIGGGFSLFDEKPRLAIARLFGGNNSGAGVFELSASTYSVNERSNAVITIVRGAGTEGSASVNVSFSNGTAANGVDFFATNVVVTFASAESVKTIGVPLVDNAVTNENKTFSVTLSNPTAGAIIGEIQSADVTILDNDSILSFGTPTYSVNEDGINARITVTRSGGGIETVTASYSTAPGTATADVDYTPQSATLVFNPGVNVQTFDIPIIDDTEIEGDETLQLTLDNPTGPGTIGTGSATLKIIENDLGPGVIGFSTSNYLVDENAGTITLTLTRTNGYSGVVSVNYATLNNTANSGLDYVGTNGVLTFADNQTNATITIQVLNDGAVEGNENFFVQLSSPSGATLGQSDATVTIVDDDSPGIFDFSQSLFTVNENGGTATITVSRHGGSIGTVSIVYSTGNAGGAAVGLDYLSVSNVLTFTNGETAKTFTVPILDDGIAEGTESIDLILSEPTGGASVGTQGTATIQILDNELSFSFSATSVAAAENAGSGTITVVRIGNTNGTDSVQFASSNGGATAGQDYVSTNGSLTFAPGETNKTFTVKVLEDTTSENTESVNITLSNPSAGVLGPIVTAPLLILDNDATFSFSAPTYSVGESFTNVFVTVVRNGGTNLSSAVSFTTSDNTASNLFDYFTASGTLTFSPGQVTNNFTVLIFDDSLIEGTETVNLSLFSPTNAVLGNQPSALLNIVDNDQSVGFSTTNYVVNEKSTNAVITLVRRGIPTGTISVSIVSANGTAIGGSDYAIVNQTVGWTNGDLAPKTIFIPVADDGVVEGSETVFLSLTNATAGVFADIGSAVLTIVDDAGSIAFASTSYSANETDGFAAIQLVRTGGSNGVVSIDYIATGVNATAGLDYTNATGTIAFGNGEVTKSILLPIINDSLSEGSETLNLVLTNAAGGALLGVPNSASLTLIDDELDIRAIGAALISESMNPSNGVIDPGETVTLQLALRNLGSINTANLVATLQTNSGVTPVTVSRTYGMLSGGGNSISQPFTFVANGTNGSVISVQLKLKDGSTDLGSVSFSFGLGTGTILFANASQITINDNAPANPYPSTINVSGISGTISKVSATLKTFTHGFARDVQVLLVSPSGQSCVLMANCGAGASGVNLTFDDSAATYLPTNQVLATGSFKPTRNGFTTFPNGITPAGPYGSALNVFNGANPNGAWSLYVYDSQMQDAGAISGGWTLNIASSNIVTAPADIGVAVSDSPDPVVVGGTYVYTVNVNNYGPGSANNVTVSNVLPAGVTFLSASRSVTNLNGAIVSYLGTLTNGSSLSFTITAKAPLAAGTVTNVTTVTSSESDLNTGNNVVSVKTSVISIPQLIAGKKGSGLLFSWPSAASNFILEYATNLAGPWQPYAGGYTSANGTNSVSISAPAGGNQFYRLRVAP